MHVELLGQLGQRPLALHGGEGHLRLEGRGVVPARSSRHRLSLPAAILAAVRQKLHSSPLSRFPEPALERDHLVARMQPESTYINGLAKTECLEKPSKIKGLAYPCNNAPMIPELN